MELVIVDVGSAGNVARGREGEARWIAGRIRGLVEEGVLVAPIGDDWLQVVRRYRKQGEAFEAEDLEGARFVPLIQDQEDGTTT